jgi:hypothetical protein
MFVGVPTNMGLGSFNVSTSLVGSGCAASGASVKENSSEHASVRVVMAILGKPSVFEYDGQKRPYGVSVILQRRLFSL